MPMDGVRDKHESYGLLSFSRTQGGNVNLFGSSIQHNNTIRMSIKRGVVERGLSMDWYYDTAEPDIVEVEMSYTQFAEAISAMNVGVGVPVTIRRVQGKRMEDCPAVNKRMQFEQEFKDSCKEIGTRLATLTAHAEELLSGKKPPTKGEKESILKQIQSLRGTLSSTLPFIQSQFNEQMDKTVTEAKGEVDAHVMHVIHGLGLQGLTAEAFKVALNSASGSLELEGEVSSVEEK